MKAFESTLELYQQQYGKVDKSNLIIYRLHNNPKEEMSSREMSFIKESLIEVKHSSFKNDPLKKLIELLIPLDRSSTLENNVLEIVEAVSNNNVGFSSDIIEKLEQVFNKRKDLTGRLVTIFKNINATEELPKSLQRNIASRLKSPEEHTEHKKEYCRLLQSPNITLDKETVLELSAAIDNIKQQEGSNLGSISNLSNVKRQERLDILRLLHSKNQIPQAQTEYIKSLAQSDYPEIEKQELQKLASDLEDKSKKLKIYGLILEQKSITIPDVSLLLDAQDPYPQAQTAALNWMVNQYKSGKKVPKDLLITLENLLDHNIAKTNIESALYIVCSSILKQKHFALQDKTASTLINHLNSAEQNIVLQQNLSTALELLIINGKVIFGAKSLSKNHSLSNESIFRALSQLTIAQRNLPKAAKEELIALSSNIEADLSVRLHSLSILHDSFPTLNKKDLSRIASLLNDQDLAIARAAGNLFYTLTGNQFPNKGFLSNLLSGYSLECHHDIKQDIDSLIYELSSISDLQSTCADSNLEELNDLESIYATEELSESYEVKDLKLIEPNLTNKSDNILNTNQLIKSLTELNNNNEAIVQLTSEGYLEKQLELITNSFAKDSKILSQGSPIKEWNQVAIKKFGQELINNPEIANNREHLPEVIAVAIRANKIHTGHDLREVQILSLLILLASDTKGRLAQIATGEGKSTTTAVLAAIKALQGQYVDVITSSQILAKRDAEERQGFFELFNLSCSHNIDPDYQSGSKECYNHKIVYGDVGNFQGDWLKDIYKDLGTRNGRQFGTAIVDEVDSMLIDDSAKIVKLSNPLPAAEYLAPSFLAAWRELDNLSKHIIYFKQEKAYVFIPGEFEYKKGELVLFGDLDDTDNISVIEDVNSFKAEHIESYLNDLLKQNIVAVPTHLKSMIENQTAAWARSALLAQSMKLKRDYLIIPDNNNEDIIAPIDYLNTGIVQGNTVWENGLQQFLQVKHNLKVTPESHTTSFISNVGYFKFYGNSIYGLTGTLGSKESVALLQDTYNIDVAFVPNYKLKTFKEYDGIITSDKQSWLNAISGSCLEEASKNRAVLIICKTIQDVEDIENTLKLNQSSFSKIIRYSRNDNHEYLAVNKQAESKQIIVATNLAGRGTDIKLSKEVEDNGGLHVCVTFLPSNSRVEEQAFGRTSRQGSPGSAQLIINKEPIIKKFKLDGANINGIDQLRKLRDLLEFNRLQEVRSTQIAKLLLNDKLFGLYNDLYKQLKSLDNNKYKLMQVEEDWGEQFKSLQRQYDLDLATPDKKAEESLRSFEQFKSITICAYQANNIIRNPSYLVAQGFNTMGKDNSYKDSIETFSYAAGLDDIYNFVALYNRAYARLREGYNNVVGNDKAYGDYIAYHKEVLEDLTTVKQQLEQIIIPQLQSMLIISPTIGNTPLSRQIHNKLELMQLLLRYVDNAIVAVSNGDVNEAMKVGDKPELLTSFFDSTNYPRSELTELRGIGLHQLYNISKEEVGSSALDSLAVSILGVAQGVFGTLAMASGNIGFGISLLTEGIKDLYSASSVSDGGFKWNNYFLDKGINVAVHFATIGAEKLFAAKPINTLGTQGIKEKIIDQAIIKQVNRQLKNQAIKEAIIKAAITTASTMVVNNVAKSVIKDNQQNLIGAIDKKIENLLNSSPTKERLNRLIAIDTFNGNTHYQNYLRSQVKSLLTEKRHVLAEISSSVLQSLRQSNNSKLALVSTVLKGVEVSYNLTKVLDLVDEFCDALAEKIAIAENQLPDLAAIFLQKIRPGINNRAEAEELVSYLQQAGIWNGYEFDESKLGFIGGLTLEKGVQGGKEPQIMQLEELNIKSFSKDSSTIANVDLGKYDKIRPKLIEVVQRLNKLMRSNYHEQRAVFAKEISGNLAGTVNNKITSKVIMPVATGFIRDFSDSATKKLLADNITLEISKTTGVSAGDQEDSILERFRDKFFPNRYRYFPKDKKTDENIPKLENQKAEGNSEVIDISPDKVFLENLLSPFELDQDSEIAKMLKSMREQTQQEPKQVPIFDSSNKTIGIPKSSSGFSLVNSAYANTFGTTTAIATFGSDLPWLEAASLSSIRSLTPYLFSTAVNVVRHVPSASITAGIVVGLHNATKFEAQHPWVSSDFDDIMNNPLVPQSTKDEMWQQMRNDPLLGNGTQSLILPHINVNDLPQLNPFAPHNRSLFSSSMLDPRFNRPNILTTPIHNQSRSILFTPDHSSTFAKFGQLEGFDISQTDKGIFESFPIHQQNWRDLILYKDNGEHTIKSRLKDQQLPNEGKIRFVPDNNYNPLEPLPKGPNHGFYDKFGNEWKKGPSRTKDEPFEWDVQLSRTGKAQLGHLSKNGKTINVSLKGKITH